MIAYNSIVKGVYIVHEGAPHEVLSSGIHRKQQRKPVNMVKMRNMRTGKTVEKTYGSGDSVEEAELSYRNIKYLYHNAQKGEYWFCAEDNPKDRFTLPAEVLGENIHFVKEDVGIEARVWGDETIGIRIPIKVELEVAEAPPNIKGNTASGGTKPVVLETGATINVPLFIEAGNIVRVNTETGEYVERA